MVAIIHVGTQEQFFGDLRPQPQPKRLAVGAWYRVTIKWTRNPKSMIKL